MDNERKKIISEKVEGVIIDYFSICDADVLKSRRRDENTNNARFYLWYILHYDFGFSFSNLSKLYCKTARNIVAIVSKTKYRIENISKYKSEYENILIKVNVVCEKNKK